MSKMFRTLVAALIAATLCSAAQAQNRNRSCPLNDRMVPENSTACRGDAIWVCKDGEWQRQDGTRCTPPKN